MMLRYKQSRRHGFSGGNNAPSPSFSSSSTPSSLVEPLALPKVSTTTMTATTTTTNINPVVVVDPTSAATAVTIPNTPKSNNRHTHATMSPAVTADTMTEEMTRMVRMARLYKTSAIPLSFVFSKGECSLNHHYHDGKDDHHGRHHGQNNQHGRSSGYDNDLMVVDQRHHQDDDDEASSFVKSSITATIATTATGAVNFAKLSTLSKLSDSTTNPFSPARPQMTLAATTTSAPVTTLDPFASLSLSTMMTKDQTTVASSSSSLVHHQLHEWMGRRVSFCGSTNTNPTASTATSTGTPRTDTMTTWPDDSWWTPVSTTKTTTTPPTSWSSPLSPPTTTLKTLIVPSRRNSMATVSTLGDESTVDSMMGSCNSVPTTIAALDSASSSSPSFQSPSQQTKANTTTTTMTTTTPVLTTPIESAASTLVALLMNRDINGLIEHDETGVETIQNGRVGRDQVLLDSRGCSKIYGAPYSVHGASKTYQSHEGSSHSVECVDEFSFLSKMGDEQESPKGHHRGENKLGSSDNTKHLKKEVVRNTSSRTNKATKASSPSFSQRNSKHRRRDRRNGSPTTKVTLGGGGGGGGRAVASLGRTPRRLLDASALVPAAIRGDMRRLAHPTDHLNVNSLHRFVRQELLEVFFFSDDSLGGGTSVFRRVGLRCVFCGTLSKEEREQGRNGTPGCSSMNVFYPKSVEDLYRQVCTWQRIHFGLCPFIPDAFKTKYNMLKDQDRTRGRKCHWKKTAIAMGMYNLSDQRSGIAYRPPPTQAHQQPAQVVEVDNEDAEGVHSSSSEMDTYEDDNDKSSAST